MAFIVIVSDFFIYLKELEKFIDNNETCIYLKLPTPIDKLSPNHFDTIQVLYNDDDQSHIRSTIFTNKLIFSGFAQIVKDVTPPFIKRDRYVLKVISL
jgi:hypothetical protein